MKALIAILSIALLTGCGSVTPSLVTATGDRMKSLATSTPIATTYQPVTIEEMLASFNFPKNDYQAVSFEGSFQDQTTYGQNNDVSHEWVLWDRQGHKIPVNNIFRFQGGNGVVYDHDFNATNSMVQWFRQYGVFVTIKGRYESGSIDVYFINDTPIEKLIPLAFHVAAPTSL